MHIVVSGSSGLIGTALVDRLRREGHEVVRLVRRAPGTGEAQWDPTAGKLDVGVIDAADAVINLAGAGIGDHRWTAEYKQEVLRSRTTTTALLANTIAASSTPPAVFLSGSAIGFYGDTGDTSVDERSKAGDGFLADVCRAWEEAAAPAEAATRLVLLRTGIVLSAKGGALKKQLPMFKLGLGGRFGSGKQWQSWVSIDDEIGAIIHLLTTDVSGPVNLTAPNPVTNAQFAKALAHALHRPSLLPIPAFGPKLLLGGELADALLFDGQRVLPTVLQQSGYTFEHPTLDGALRAVLAK